MIFPLLLLYLSSGAGLGETHVPVDTTEAAQAPEVAEAVFRRYDFAAHSGQGRDWDQPVNLFPGTRKPNSTGEGGTMWSFYPDDIQQLLLDTLGDELEYEGRHHQLSEDGQFLLRAPESVHASVRKILSFLGEATGSSASLRVEILTVEDGAMPRLKSGVVDMADIARIGTGITAPITRELYSMPLTVNRMASMDGAGVNTFLGDFYVEVAQQAFGYDPVVVQMLSGTRLQVMTSPTEGGCNLGLIYWHGTANGGIEDRNLDIRGRISSETGFSGSTGPDRLQSFSVGQRTLALNTMIPTGKALVIQTNLDLAESQGSQWIVLSIEGRLQPTTRHLRLANGTEIYLIRNDSFAPATIEVHNNGFHANELTSRFRAQLDNTEGGLMASFRRGEVDVSGDALNSMLPDLSWHVSREWTMVVVGLEEDATGSEGIPALVEAIQPRSELVQISLFIDRPGEGDSRSLSCFLPLRVGIESCIVLGTEASSISEFNVEIAQGSSVNDPIGGIDLDGTILFIHPRRTVDGELRLRIRGGVQLLRDRQVLEAKDLSFSQMELPVYDRLEFDQTIHVHGAGAFVIGNDAKTRSGSSLSLSVQVH